MRILSIYLLAACLMLAGCQSKKTAADFETVTKDSTFRTTITTGQFIKLSEGYTYYEWSNLQADTVLVLVHGFSVPSYIWDSTFYAASKRGYSTLRYDNFGRGFSENPDAVYDVALFTNQLHELLDSLKITKPITLVGLSDGGRSISSFAAQFPARVNNLVYVDAVSFENPVENPQHPAAVTKKEIEEFKSSESYPKMGFGQLGDFYDSIPFRGWDKKYEEIMKFKGFARAIISTRKNRTPLVEEHRKIAEANVPVFAIWGEHDTVVVLDDVRGNLTTRFPSSKLFVIPKAGHLPHM
ncbi:MAG: alpha/beta hydrolase, partial [Bacteroidetes bacterium]|nr:alpha/beta hydrolase [Bacteroidota bacterium]